MSKVLDFHPQFDEVLSYHFDSGNAGPHLLLLGGIHGNETCGQVALQALVDEIDSGELPLKAGKVTLVPQCNPWACASNVRYVEANLNRVITRHENPQNYEERIADIICDHIEKCDAMVISTRRMLVLAHRLFLTTTQVKRITNWRVFLAAPTSLVAGPK